MVKKTINKIKEAASTIIIIITLLSGGATFAWCKIALPSVDKRIDKKQEPIVKELKSIGKALEYQNFMMMEGLSDSTLDNIDKKYIISNRGRAK